MKQENADHKNLAPKLSIVGKQAAKIAAGMFFDILEHNGIFTGRDVTEEVIFKAMEKVASMGSPGHKNGIFTYDGWGYAQFLKDSGLNDIKGLSPESLLARSQNFALYPSGLHTYLDNNGRTPVSAWELSISVMDFAKDMITKCVIDSFNEAITEAVTGPDILGIGPWDDDWDDNQVYSVIFEDNTPPAPGKFTALGKKVLDDAVSLVLVPENTDYRKINLCIEEETINTMVENLINKAARSGSYSIEYLLDNETTFREDYWKFLEDTGAKDNEYLKPESLLENNPNYVFDTDDFRYSAISGSLADRSEIIREMDEFITQEIIIDVVTIFVDAVKKSFKDNTRFDPLSNNWDHHKVSEMIFS